MALQVSYAPGDHALLGAGNRWLFLDTPAAVGEAELLNRLWEILASPSRVQERLLAAAEDGLGQDLSLVWVDATPGAQSIVCRGTGRCTGDQERRELSLSGGTAVADGLRVASGVVGASWVVVRSGGAGGLPGAGFSTAISGTSSTPVEKIEGLIDGIPEEVLLSRCPATPSARPAAYVSPEHTEEPPVPRVDQTDHDGHTTLHHRPAPAVPAQESQDEDHDGHTTHRPTSETAPTAPTQDEDHDGHTTFRPDGSAEPESNHAPTSPPPVGPPAHLSNAVHETVLAVHCPAGHTTQASAALCRVCGTPVTDQEPVRVPRPRLGSLRLPDGQQIPLDRAVLFGRAPSVPDAPELGEAWPHLVRLPSETSFVSRTHLLVELKGWMVVVTDLGSRGGTTLRVPGRTPERIRAREQYVWEPGQVFDLADSYEILYEVVSG